MHLSKIQKMFKIFGLSALVVSMSACTDGDFPLFEILPEVGETEERGNGGDTGGGTDNGDGTGSGNLPPLPKTDNVTAFSETIYQTLTAVDNGCVSCHADVVEPFISSNDAEIALRDLVDYTPVLLTDYEGVVDLSDAANSLLVKLMTDEEHQCGDNCAALGEEFTTGIETWSRSVDERFTSGVSVKADIEAYGATLHQVFTASCSGCHASGSRTPAGSDDIVESYFAMDRNNRLKIEEAEPGVVAFIQGDHFGTVDILPEVEAAVAAWKALTGGDVGDVGGIGTNPPTEEEIKAAYEANIHPLVTQNNVTCTGCHQDFASLDLDTAYQATRDRNLIDLININQSRLSTGLVDPMFSMLHIDGACGDNVTCEQLSTQIVEAIEASLSVSSFLER